MFLTGAASTVKIIKDRTTTEIGLRITNLATSAHLPSSFVTFTLLRTNPLSILVPKIASKAGSAINAPATAIRTTVIPAYPNDFKNICGNKVNEAKVSTTVRPE
ncbi:unannotated protein [freshwater metagenome]|uniref:Unannotated protein n=1 Tax=freshwater metagenome TaxID=449393 RepID=A0A6J6NFW0_9ZZZZ